jgi:uncharacterized membrane protein YfcA
MTLLLPAAIGLVAVVYASVGHAGATGYVAVMTLLGLPAATIRPTALALNVLVATIATVQFARAGHFRSRLFWPLAVASVPCAFVGGAITLPTGLLERVLAVVLLAAAARMLVDLRRRPENAEPSTADTPPRRPGIRCGILAALGGGVGVLSGLTGIGGGVFLTPVLVALAAAPVKSVAAVTAPFILVNSIAGLAGGLLAGRGLPAAGLPVVAAAVVGGAIGSQLGAFRLPARALSLTMACVLAVAAAKLFM